jgi:hypothetical protein
MYVVKTTNEIFFWEKLCFSGRNGLGEKLQGRFEEERERKITQG